MSRDTVSGEERAWDQQKWCILYRQRCSVMFLRPLSSDVEIDAAIPTVRNLVYAKASHSGTLHAGHRAWEMLACLSQSRPQRPLACRPQSLGCYRHADSIFLPRCAPRVPKGGWSELCKKTSTLHNNLCLGLACSGQSEFSWNSASWSQDSIL